MVFRPSDSLLPNIFKPPLTKQEMREYKERMSSDAAQYAQEAIERLVYWMRDTANPSVSLAATNQLLDRAFGKPKEQDTRDESQVSKLPDLNVQIVFVDHDGRTSDAVMNKTVEVTHQLQPNPQE